MYAIEFETKSQGRFIELPFDISDKESMKLKVVVMSDVALEQYMPKKTNSDYLQVLKSRKLQIAKDIDIDRLIDEMNG